MSFSLLGVAVALEITSGLGTVYPQMNEVYCICHLMIFSGLNRSAFDNKTVSFEEHIKCEHNMWHYLYFIVLVKVKDPTEFTGPESYVYAMVKVQFYT